jgi:hypothetical protein
MFSCDVNNVEADRTESAAEPYQTYGQVFVHL